MWIVYEVEMDVMDEEAFDVGRHDSLTEAREDADFGLAENPACTAVFVTDDDGEIAYFADRILGGRFMYGDTSRSIRTIREAREFLLSRGAGRA